MKPNVLVYNVMSIDGRISWMMNDYSLISDYYTVGFNFKCDAVLMGSNTIFNIGQHEVEAEAVPLPKPEHYDLPEGIQEQMITPKPLLVVPDSAGRIHNWRLMQKEPWYADILVLCSESTPKSYLDYLKIREINYLIIGKEKVDLAQSMELLNKEYNIQSIKTDCGGKLIGQLMSEKLVDEIKLFIAPKLIGGNPFPNIMESELINQNNSVDLELVNSEIIMNKYVLLSYKVIKQ